MSKHPRLIEISLNTAFTKFCSELQNCLYEVLIKLLGQAKASYLVFMGT